MLEPARRRPVRALPYRRGVDSCQPSRCSHRVIRVRRMRTARRAGRWPCPLPTLRALKLSLRHGHRKRAFSKPCLTLRSGLETPPSRAATPARARPPSRGRPRRIRPEPDAGWNGGRSGLARTLTLPLAPPPIRPNLSATTSPPLSPMIARIPQLIRIVPCPRRSRIPMRMRVLRRRSSRRRTARNSRRRRQLMDPRRLRLQPRSPSRLSRPRRRRTWRPDSCGNSSGRGNRQRSR